jgi:hypothetical protein
MKYRIDVIGADMQRWMIYYAPHFTPLGNGAVRVTSAYRVNTNGIILKIDMLFLSGPIIEIKEISDGEFNTITRQKSDAQE